MEVVKVDKAILLELQEHGHHQTGYMYVAVGCKVGVEDTGSSEGTPILDCNLTHRVHTVHTERSIETLVDYLRVAQQPLQLFGEQVILNIQEPSDSLHHNLGLLAVTDIAVFHEDDICEPLRVSWIVLADHLNKPWCSGMM